MAKVAKIPKISSKLAKYSSGAAGSGMFTKLVTIAIYVAIAYILYKVAMYFLNMRSSAMPDVPNSSKTDGAKGGNQKPKCPTGTCGSK
jgi:hypothetical protein